MSERVFIDEWSGTVVPMTQPIYPDEGDALKALVASVLHNPECILGMSEWDQSLFTEAEKQCSCDRDERLVLAGRTDPPVAMDEEELLAKEFEKVDGYRGDIHRTLARIALTRIKDSSK